MLLLLSDDDTQSANAVTSDVFRLLQQHLSCAPTGPPHPLCRDDTINQYHQFDCMIIVISNRAAAAVCAIIVGVKDAGVVAVV